jgi:hypothetical protein
VPVLSHTIVPPRAIRTDVGANPLSATCTWVPLGGVGGGEDVVVEVEELEVEVDVALEVDVELEVVLVVLAVLVVLVPVEELDVVVVLVEVVAVLVEDEALGLADGDGLGDAQVGGIVAGAGSTGCQFGSMSIADAAGAG